MFGKLFSPAIGLMNRLKYPQKFLIISLLLDLPSALLIYLLTSIRNEAIDFGAKERLGIEYSKPVKELLVHLHQRREFSTFVLNGNLAFKDQLAAAEANIVKDIDAINKVDQKLGDDLQSSQRWKVLKEKWDALLRKEAAKMQAAENYAANTEVIDGTLDLLYYVGDSSNLILDPDIDTYYLMDCMVTRDPLMLQKLQQAIDLGTQVSLGKKLPADKRAELIFVLPGVIRSTLDGLDASVHKYYDYKNPSADAPNLKATISKEYDDAFAAINAFLAKTDSIRTVDLDSTNFNAKLHAAAGNLAVAATIKLYDAQAVMLDKLIEIRVDTFTKQKRLMQIGVPILWILVIYLLIGFYRSVMATVHSLEDISEKLVQGSDAEVALDAKDELAGVGRSFNTIGQALVSRNHELEENKKQLEATNALLADSNKRIQEQQSQLIQGEKMSSLGQMVAGLAHEVNTPLGFVRNNIEVIDRNQIRIAEIMAQYRDLRESLILGNLDDLETKLVNLSAATEKMERMNMLDKNKIIISESLTGLDRIQELITNLKNFSRLDETAVKAADINKGIDATLTIANNMLKHKVEVKKEYEPNLVAECHPAQLNQVFLNIITNAAQSIEQTGVITIRTSHQRGRRSDDVDLAVIKIADTGKGIPKENLDKIFEPFFTTKEIGQGTGLGLSIVYKIIEKHHGTITVESEVGKGTEFTIKIPLKHQNEIVAAAEPAY
jgi:signal transduction histidine kinase